MTKLRWSKRTQCRLAATLLAALLGSCRTPAPGPRASVPAPAEFTRIEWLIEDGRLEDALAACIELSRQDPYRPGLAELQERVLNALLRERERVAARRSANAERAAAADIAETDTVPDTYRLRRAIRGERGSLRTPGGPTRQMLDKKVTLHLDNVGLTDFILQVGQTEGINIVADAMASDRTLSIHAEQVPFREILDFVSRNLGVTFYVGENLIWATPAAQEQAGAPMETRIYRLRKGRMGTEVAEGSTSNAITRAIETFVEQPEGAALQFEPRAHALIVRNTRANLDLIEDIVEALDVVPPQILIEARFIAVDVTDLSELGIDWFMDSAIALSKQQVGGSRRARTQINSGAGIGFEQFPNQAVGLNFTYQGLLTEPMFRAVLHALETSGKARTLSVPKVTTLNNLPASIRIGEDFRYFEEYDVQSIPASVSDGGNTTYQTTLVPVGRPTLEELGIELSVTPSVGADLEDILLTLAPEISEFVRYEFYNTADNNNGGNNGGNNNNGIIATNAPISLIKVPIFRRSTISTQVRVRSSETVVMGGLISTTDAVKRSGVPILSRIPIIGHLFTRLSTDTTRKNLMIFVTATLISNRGESLVPVEPEPAAPAAPPADAVPAEAPVPEAPVN